jgi:WD40 repeat protein
MKKLLCFLAILWANLASVEAAYNNLDDVVAGMTTGSAQYCYIRSGSNLSGISFVQQAGLRTGVVLKDGNVVWGNTGGQVSIRSGTNLSYVAHNNWGSDIVAMAACPDGNVVFATAAGNVYKRSGTNLRDIAQSLGYGAGSIAELAVAPNGDIIIGCNNGTVYVRDAMLNGITKLSNTFGTVTALAVQPNGNIVIGNVEGNLWVRNGMLGAMQADAGYGSIVDIAVQLNGNIVVGSADGAVRIRSGSSIGVGLASNNYGPIYRVACQGDGDVVVASSYNNGTIWLSDGSNLATKASGSGFYQITFLGVQVGQPPVVEEVERISAGWYDNADWEASIPASIANGDGKFVVLYAGAATTQQKIQQYVDQAHTLGVKIVLSVKEIVETGNTTALMNRVNTFKSHPAVMGWYIMDEPYGSGTSLSNCETAYTMIKQVDAKSIYAGFCNSDLDHNTPSIYRNAYDVMMYDNYPFKHGQGQFAGLTDWKGGCDLARNQAQAINKPLHMIIQGFGWIPSLNWTWRLPTLPEERFMVFYSLFNGAKGIEFWAEDARTQSVVGSSDPYPYDGWQWMNDVGKSAAMELNRIGTAVMAGAIADGVVDNHADMQSSVYQDPITDQYFLLALNNTIGSKTATFTLALPSQFAYAIPLFENAGPISIQNGTFSDTFIDYAARSYLLASAIPIQPERVVVGSPSGNYAVRSGIDLSGLKVSAKACLSAGTVLPNGNIVLGSTSANGGLVEIRNGKTLTDIAADYWGSDVVAMAACPDGNVVFATAAGSIYKRSGTNLSDIASSGGYGANAIKDIAVAPNGNILIAAVYGSGQYICLLNGQFEGVAPTNYSTFGLAMAVAFQQNGNIVIGNSAGSLWVCDGQLSVIQTTTGLGNITDIAVQANGNIVVGNTQGMVRVLNGNNIATVISSASELGQVYKLACLSNGDVVVASAVDRGQIRILDAADLTVVKAYDYGLGVVNVLNVQPEMLIPGDANKDGMVDVGDLGILAANYGGSDKNWEHGDFNGDHLVDVGDLGILAANYGSSNFSADYAKAFGTGVEEEDTTDETAGSICSALGLPLVIGLLLAGLMLVKLED